MDRSDQSLDLAWDTFDFHTLNLSELEVQQLQNLKQYKNLKATLNPSQRYKLHLKKKLIKHFNKLIYEYNKYIFSIDDIIDHHEYRLRNEIPIPLEREIPIVQLYQLKNVTATLMEEVIAWKNEVNEILG